MQKGVPPVGIAIGMDAAGGHHIGAVTQHLNAGGQFAGAYLTAGMAKVEVSATRGQHFPAERQFAVLALEGIEGGMGAAAHVHIDDDDAAWRTGHNAGIGTGIVLRPLLKEGCLGGGLVLPAFEDGCLATDFEGMDAQAKRRAGKRRSGEIAILLAGPQDIGKDRMMGSPMKIRILC